MSSTHGYDRDSFLIEFFPESSERAEVEAGARALIEVNTAHRLAGPGKRPAEVTERAEKGGRGS